MLPASSTEKGQCVSFPDVCKTPAGPAVVLFVTARGAGDLWWCRRRGGGTEPDGAPGPQALIDVLIFLNL